MSAPDQKIDLTQVEHSIQYSKVSFFAFIQHISPTEFSIDDGLGDVVEQDCLAIQLPLGPI